MGGGGEREREGDHLCHLLNFVDIGDREDKRGVFWLLPVLLSSIRPGMIQKKDKVPPERCT